MVDLPFDADFFAPLLFVWFLLYWILGGVFFSILAFIRVHRIRRTRFGCLFSLVTAGLALLTVWTGTLFALQDLVSCQVQTATSPVAAMEAWIQQFACGVVPLTVAWVVGLCLLLVLGFVLMHISRRTDPTWIEGKGKEK